MYFSGETTATVYITTVQNCKHVQEYGRNCVTQNRSWQSQQLKEELIGPWVGQRDLWTLKQCDYFEIGRQTGSL
jgi:hypothetical protein